MTLNVIHVISLMTFRINYVNNYDLKMVNISYSSTRKRKCLLQWLYDRSKVVHQNKKYSLVT